MWVVVGASAGLGRALAERLAEDHRSLLVVASDERDLVPLGAELGITSGADVRTLAHDAADHAGLAERIDRALGEAELEGLLFPIGSVRDDDTGDLDGAEAEDLVRINLLSIVSVTSRLVPRMVAQGRGSIVGFGSIAAARGRSRNVLYAACKRGLESYFESLRHRCERHGITVAWYVLGYVDTNQSFGRPLLLSAADPATLARRICGDLGRARGRHYLPRAWRMVALFLRCLPWTVFRRVEA